MLGEERLKQRREVVEALRSFTPGQIAVKLCRLILADVQCIVTNGDAMAAAGARRAVVDEWYGLIFGVPVSDSDEGHGADAGEDVVTRPASSPVTGAVRRELRA